MLSILLREAVARGFCGQKKLVKGIPPDPLAAVHYALDRAIMHAPLDQLDQEHVRIQLTNQAGLPYEQHKYFHECLLGIFERREIFKRDELDINDTDEGWGGNPDYPVKFVSFLRKKDGAMVEPRYAFYSPMHHWPVYSLMVAFMMGVKQSIKIRTVSVLGEFDHEEEYPMQDLILKDTMARYAVAEEEVPGPQCLTCPRTDCKFVGEFGQTAYAYLKAKQAFEEAELKMKDFLATNGPHKCGVHMMYMNEHNRHFFNPKNFQTFQAAVTRHSPKGHMQYFNPDAKEVMKAIKKGDLPKDLEILFKRSNYYTIESAISL